MKNILTALLLSLLMSAFIPQDSDPETFRKLYGLEGVWLMKTKNGFIGEEWKKVDANYLQNRGFMIRGTDTTTTESVALRNKEDGIYYTSTVEDQNDKQPVAFKLTSADNNIFVFENAEHDFPKRITYHLVTKDSLSAWIDGGAVQPGKRSSFGYKRIK
ncbi:MAG: DUF6265 family protein [Ferruginibacter sp.]